MGFLKKRDYSTAVVVERKTYDECDILKNTEYYIEYVTTLFGIFTYKERFFEWYCGMGDCMTTDVYRLTKKKLLEDYNKFLIRNRKTMITKKIVAKVNDVKCEENE